MKPIKPIIYLIFQSHNYKFTFSDILKWLVGLVGLVPIFRYIKTGYPFRHTPRAQTPRAQSERAQPRRPHPQRPHIMSQRMKGGRFRRGRCASVCQGMSKKENETNQTNQMFNFPISQFQILFLKYLKMIGWIG